MKPPITTAYTEAEILSAAASIAAGKRKRSGPKPTLRPCPKCGQMFGARDLRKHKPACSGR